MAKLLSGTRIYGNVTIDTFATATGNITAGNLITAGQLISTIATGTAPLTITSTTKVTNLNVEQVDGYHADITATVSNIAVRDANANLYANNYIGTTFTSNVATGTAPFTVSSTTQVANLSVATAGSATTAGTVTTAAQPNITSVGTLSSLAVTANANVGNLNSSGIVYANNNVIVGSTGGEGGQIVVGYVGINNITGQANGTWNMDVDGSNNFRLFNQNATGVVSGITMTAYSGNNNTSFAGNVSAPYFIGNGSQLTGITVSAGSSIVNGTSNVNIPSSGGNVNTSVGGVANVLVVSSTQVTAPIFAATDNGNGTNFKVGDDVWLGDINTADTLSIRGQQSALNGYIVFGNSDSTAKLGRAGTGPLTYAGAFSVSDTIISNAANGSAFVATGNAINNVALGISSTAGTAANMAIRDLSTVSSVMYFDVSVGGTPNGSFQFRTTNAFASLVTISNAGLSVNTGVFIGNGNSLSSLQGANVTGTVANATYAVSAGSATTAGTVTTANQPNITGVGNITSGTWSANVVGLAYGGTGKATAPAAMAALMGYTSTATAAGTTTLTNTSSYYQQFTGVSTQTVVLPVTSTLQTGWTFHIVNNSTGNLTVQSSGLNLIITVPPGTTAMLTCISTATTTAADWESGITDFSTYTGSGSVVLSTSPILTTPNIGAATGTSLGISGAVTASTLVSNVATGTAPFTVTSTTKVTNLNVEQVDGYHADITATVSNIAVRDANANLYANNYIGTTFTSNVATGTAPFTVTSTTQVANLSVATAGSATTAGTVTTAAQPNITSVGTLTSLGVNGTVTAVAFTANTGVFTGNGNGLSSIVGANVTGTVANATYAVSAGSATSATNAAALLTTLTSTGTVYIPFISATANSNYAHLSNANFSANLANGYITATGFVGTLSGAATSATTAGTVTTNAQPNITSVGTLSSLTVTANTTSGNLSTGGELSVTGNAIITGNLSVNGTTIYSNVTTMNIKDPIIELGGTGNANPLTSNDGKDRGELLHVYDVAASAQVDKFIGWDNSNAEFAFGSNVTVTNEVVAFNTLGNIRAGYILGNGSSLTSLTGDNVTGTVPTANNASFLGGTAAASYLLTTGTGTSLTAITGANVTGTVANATYAVSAGSATTATSATTAGTVTTAAQGNITSVGTLTTLNVSGNANVGNLGTAGIIVSSIATGTAPFTVASTTKVTNLNVEQVDGYHADITATVSNIAVRDANANLYANNYIGRTFTSNVATGTAPFTVTSTTQVANLSVATAGTATTAGTVTTNAQPNITSVGTLTSLTANGTTAINLAAGNTATIAATAPPTADMLIVTNAGQAVATAGISAAQITYVGGAGAIEASAIRADMTPGPTSGSTWNAIRIAATAAAATGVIYNGVKFDAKTAGTGTSRALYVGTGYDDIINYNGTSVIYGNGIVNGAQVSTVSTATTAGTVTTNAQPNITSVGTLTSLGVSGAVTASTLVSNVATGTAPFTVTSTTQVANLNVASAGSITNDTTTNLDSYYPLMATATSGALSTTYVSSTKMYYNPSTGQLNTTNFNSLSDETKKQNIITITNAVNTVSSMNGVEFAWIDNGKKSAGVIAQQIEKIVPHLVDTSSDGIKSVNYSGIIGYLIESIKEQQTQLSELKSEIVLLKQNTKR